MTSTLLTVARQIANSLRIDQASFDLHPATDWAIVVHHADGHSLTPLLYDTWRNADQLTTLPSDICQRMEQSFIDNTQRNEAVRQEVLEIHHILNNADVSHIALKGWSLVEALYSHPAHRVLYDHDFLVPQDRAKVGHQALMDAGFRPLPGKDEWVEKHLQPLWRNNGYQWDGYLFDPHYPRPVELHIHLWEQNWRGLRVSEMSNLWESAQMQSIAGAPMQTLSSEDTLVHLAMHFAGHLIEREARLNQLLDLARFITIAGPFDWNIILQQTKQANIGRFVYASLYLAQKIFGSALPPKKVWQQLTQSTPSAFREWLASEGEVDVLTSDYRRVEKGKDYRLTFLAAQDFREHLGIAQFAALPPVEQLMKKYNFHQRWLGPLYYLRFVFERIRDYGRAVIRSTPAQ